MSAADRERWEARWAAREARDGGEPPGAPEPFLVRRAGALPPGPVLDVACGDGRNALYLARRGYEVDAIDASDLAIHALRAAARERDLPITPRVVDLEREPLPEGPYDAIVVVNFLQRDLFGALQDALAPDGLLVYETLSRAHVDELGHDFNPAYLLERGELPRAFPGLEVVDEREGVVGEPGAERGIASIVARRPGR